MIIVGGSFVELISEVQRGVSLSASSRSITLQRNFTIVRYANFESQFRPYVYQRYRMLPDLFSSRPSLETRNTKHESFVENKVDPLSRQYTI